MFWNYEIWIKIRISESWLKFIAIFRMNYVKHSLILTWISICSTAVWRLWTLHKHAQCWYRFLGALSWVWTGWIPNLPEDVSAGCSQGQQAVCGTPSHVLPGQFSVWSPSVYNIYKIFIKFSVSISYSMARTSFSYNGEKRSRWQWP